MKDLIRIIFLGVLASLSTIPSVTIAQLSLPEIYVEKISVSNSSWGCPTGSYTLVFEDNFNGPTMDLDKWSVGPNWGERGFRKGGSGNWFQYNLGTDNITFQHNSTIGSNTVKLISKTESNLQKDDNTLLDGEDPDTIVDNEVRTFPFSMAEFWTRRKFYQGKFEIRCKIQSIHSSSPAFWLLGADDFEPDIFEFRKDDEQQAASESSKKIRTDLHFDGTAFGKTNTDIRHNEPIQMNTDLSQAFHTYTFEWDDYKYEWSVDGVAKRTVYRHKKDNLLHTDCKCSDAKPQNDVHHIPDRSAFLVFETNGPAFESIFTNPTHFEVDYVKVWQRMDCNKDLSLSETITKDEERDYHAKTISAGGGSGYLVTADPHPNAAIGKYSPDSRVHFNATNYIELNPGFEVTWHNRFKGQIRACNDIQIPIEPAIQEETTSTAEESIKSQPDLRVFPNPSRAVLNIEVDKGMQISECILYDITGKPVLHKDLGKYHQLDESHLQIQVDQLTDGTYLLLVRTNNGDMTYKVNIKR